MKRIILCGGSGYIGTKLTEVLIAETEYELVIIDRLDFKLDPEFKKKYYDLDRVTFYQKDIRDLEFMQDVLNNGDYVVNLAKKASELGCLEALFTLGERPEPIYPQAKKWLKKKTKHYKIKFSN